MELIERYKMFVEPIKNAYKKETRESTWKCKLQFSCMDVIISNLKRFDLFDKNWCALLRKCYIHLFSTVKIGS
jgi:hypothetical protein